MAGCNTMRHTLGMTDDADRQAAMDRLKKADARVRKHEAERRDLADAIVAARLAGWRPSEVEAVVHYDRNHIGRITRGKVPPLREPKPE